MNDGPRAHTGRRSLSLNLITVLCRWALFPATAAVMLSLSLIRTLLSKPAF